MLKKQYLTLVPAILLASGCASQQAMQTKPPVRQGNVQITQTQVIKVKPTPVIIEQTPTVKPVPKSYNSFYDWKNDFTSRAIASGYSPSDCLLYTSPSPRD